MQETYWIFEKIVNIIKFYSLFGRSPVLQLAFSYVWTFRPYDSLPWNDLHRSSGWFPDAVANIKGSLRDDFR